jgi:hypothetical protein
MNKTTMQAGGTVDFGGETVTVIGFRRGLVTTGDRAPAIAPVARVRFADGTELEVPVDSLEARRRS